MGTSQSAQHTCGYRVLNVQPGSPSANGGLVTYFDFIMKANDIRFEEENDSFVQLIKQCENKPLKLVIYNTKSRSFREVTLKPNRNWGGTGLLGITIKHDSYDKCDNVLRVLDVVKNSPAAEAGLIAEEDFILGTANDNFADAGELFEIVQEHMGHELDLYVYSTETDCVRVSKLVPNKHWGGEGCLGFDVGSGYLHTLPVKSRSTNGKNNFVVSQEAKVPGPSNVQDQSSAPESAPSLPPPITPKSKSESKQKQQDENNNEQDQIKNQSQNDRNLVLAREKAKQVEEEYLRFFVEEMDMERELGLAKIVKARTDPTAKGKLKSVYEANCAVLEASAGLGPTNQQN